MIHDLFKLNGRYIPVANSWDDLSFNGYYRVMKLKADDYKEVISILTGFDAETLAAAEITGLETILSAASFLNTPPVFEGYTPTIGKYTLPSNNAGQFNIQFESLGQFEDMRVIMKACTDIHTLVEAYPKFVSIYLQKIRDGGYDPEKAKAMVEEIKALPAKEVIILGGFFYLKLTSLLPGTRTNSQPPSQSPKKSKPDSTDSLKPSAPTPASTGLPEQ